MDSEEDFNSPQSSDDEGMADFDSDVSDQDGGEFMLELRFQVTPI
jgi:hypothetical protein